MKVKVRKRVLKDECQFLVHDIGNRFHKVKPTKQRQYFKTRFEMISEKENSLRGFPINAKIKPCERELIRKQHKSTK